MGFSRTGDEKVDRAFDAASAASARAGKSDLAKGKLAVPIVYSVKTVVLLPGQSVLVWRGRSAASVSLPPAASLGAGVSQPVCVQNQGTGMLTVKPYARETIGDGVGAVGSIAVAPRSACLLWSDGVSGWSGSIAPGSAEQDYRRGQAASAGAETWYYANCANCTPLAAAALTANRMYAMPFIAPKRGGVLDRIAIRVTTGIGASNCRLGLYANAGSSENPYPGALIRDSGNLGTTGAAVVADTGVAQALAPGALYWVVAHVSAAISIACMAVAGAGTFFGADNTLSLTPTAGIFNSQAFGALPAAFPAGSTNIVAAPIPGIAMRFAS
jgi:hypothetical protein